MRSFWAIYAAPGGGTTDMEVSGRTREEVLADARDGTPEGRSLARIVSADRMKTLWVGDRWTAEAGAFLPT